MTDTLPYLSSAYVEVENLKDTSATPPVLVSDAVVTVTLYKKDGASTPITNATNLTASPVVGTAGKYRATIPATAVVELGKTYRCEAAATKGGLTTRFWQEVIVQRLGA